MMYNYDHYGTYPCRVRCLTIYRESTSGGCQCGACPVGARFMRLNPPSLLRVSPISSEIRRIQMRNNSQPPTARDRSISPSCNDLRQNSHQVSSESLRKIRDLINFRENPFSMRNNPVDGGIGGNGGTNHVSRSLCAVSSLNSPYLRGARVVTSLTRQRTWPRLCFNPRANLCDFRVISANRHTTHCNLTHRNLARRTRSEPGLRDRPCRVGDICEERPPHFRWIIVSKPP